MNILLPILASVLFGSVAAALVSHFLTTFRADREYRLRKLEELYMALEAASRHLRLLYHLMTKVADCTMSWKDAAQKSDTLTGEFQRDQATAKMIASVYFPDLVFVVDRLQEVADQRFNTIESFRVAHVHGKASPGYRTQFQAAFVSVLKRKREACEKVIEISKDVRRGWFRTLLNSATSW
jgi:hypothetical protein